MIVFLTLCYVAVLGLLIKLKVIKLNLWWKISPAVWMLILLIVLFIPMQWGAPSGTVTNYNYVVEIVPNVSGEVIEVSVEALKPLKKGDVLFKIDPTPFEYNLGRLRASLKEAQVARDLAKTQLDRNIKLAAQSAAAQRKVDDWRAQYDSSLATIQRIKEEIKDAEWNLDQTVVTASADGYLIGLTLHPGQRVTNLPVRTWMAFVNSEASRLIAGIKQNMLRHVRTGQKAEVVFKLFPGRTFTATVETIAPLTPQGQLQPSGIVPTAPTPNLMPATYGVILKLDDKASSLQRLPGGAIGTAAIYTDNVKATHIIRKVMMRMQSWMNYIIPY